MKESSLLEFRNVTPVSPPAAYIGGKRLLSKKIVPMIETIPHTTYAEVFMGMGGVFLRRTRVPKAEVVNDYSRDVATLFRILQRHYAAFMDLMRYQLTTRAEFERLKATDPNTLTDLERAARFLFLQRTAFGGKVTGRNFGVSVGEGASFNITRLGPILEALHDRLAGVVIECLPWSDMVARYDRPGTLFYLDPPYYNSETDYGADLFDRGQFEKMADQLAGISGRFILSLNDHPEVRRIFKRFKLQQADTSYTLSGKAKPVKELIISGGG